MYVREGSYVIVHLNISRFRRVEVNLDTIVLLYCKECLLDQTSLLRLCAFRKVIYDRQINMNVTENMSTYF